MKKYIEKLNDETGVTLVELLAAIAILSIIVTAFLGFFVQAANTNQHTNKINEATFLAQEKMEEIIHNAPMKPKTGKEEPGNSKKSFEIETAIQEVTKTNLHKVIVTVKEGGKTRAKMETVLSFESEKTE